MAFREIAKDTEIFREGESGSTIYEVLKGKVAIVVGRGGENEQVLTELGPGAMFGELAAVDSGPRSASAVATEDTVVEESAVSDLEQFLREKPERFRILLQSISKRIRELTRDYADVCAAIAEANEERKKGGGKKGLWKRLMTFLGVYNSYGPVPTRDVEPVSAPLVRNEETRREVFSDGDVLFRQGDKSDCMFVLRDGEVAIYSNYATNQEKELTVLKPGSFFGEMGMVDDAPRSATAVVRQTGAQVERFTPADLEKLVTDAPELAKSLLRHMSQRLRNLTVDYLGACKTAGDLAISIEKHEELDAEAREMAMMYASFNIYSGYGEYYY